MKRIKIINSSNTDLRSGDVIKRGGDTDKVDLVLKCIHSQSFTAMTLVPVSKYKIIRAIQKFYYLKIKNTTPLNKEHKI